MKDRKKGGAWKVRRGRSKRRERSRDRERERERERGGDRDREREMREGPVLLNKGVPKRRISVNPCLFESSLF